nr:MAG TPA: hypothetical protein [Caudoviricetes sp.]
MIWINGGLPDSNRIITDETLPPTFPVGNPHR